MREILFKGKSVDTGEWVEGFYSRVTNNWEQKNVHFITCYKDLSNGETVLTGQHIIDPETIGQYTGLKDKNGVKIFEGDIIEINCYAYEEPEHSFLGIVEVGEFGYGLLDPDGKEGYIFNYLYELRGSYTTTYEVLGYSHDNPEILEVSDNA